MSSVVLKRKAELYTDIKEIKIISGAPKFRLPKIIGQKLFSEIGRKTKNGGNGSRKRGGSAPGAAHCGGSPLPPPSSLSQSGDLHVSRS